MNTYISDHVWLLLPSLGNSTTIDLIHLRKENVVTYDLSSFIYFGSITGVTYLCTVLLISTQVCVICLMRFSML